jgi:hypothetical protein
LTICKVTCQTFVRVHGYGLYNLIPYPLCALSMFFPIYISLGNDLYHTLILIGFYPLGTRVMVITMRCYRVRTKTSDGARDRRRSVNTKHREVGKATRKKGNKNEEQVKGLS